MWRFERSGVRCPEHGVRSFDEVRQPKPRLNAGCLREAVITSYSQTWTQRQVPQSDRILNVPCVLLDGIRRVELEEASTPCQVERKEARLQVGIWLKSCTGTVVGICNRRSGDGVASPIQADRIEVERRDSESKLLGQAGSHELCPEFHIMLALHVRHVCFETKIREPSILGYRERIVVGDVRAWVIVNVVLTNVRIDR